MGAAISPGQWQPWTAVLPNKAETAVHCSYDIAVRMRKVLARPQSRSQSFVPLDQRSENESSRSIHFEIMGNNRIALFTVNAAPHLHYNEIKHLCEAISGYFVVLARNCLVSTLNYIVMQMRKANREKGYSGYPIYCAVSVCIYFMLWRMPEMVAPRALVF